MIVFEKSDPILNLATELVILGKERNNIHHGFHRNGWIGGRGRSSLSLAPHAA